MCCSCVVIRGRKFYSCGIAEVLWLRCQGPGDSDPGPYSCPRAHCRRARAAAHWPALQHEFIAPDAHQDRKSTRLNSSHVSISYAVFCLKKKRKVDNIY